MAFFQKFIGQVNEKIDDIRNDLRNAMRHDEHAYCDQSQLGPFIKFIGTDLEEQRNRYSIMIAVGRNSGYAPLLTLSKGTIEFEPILLDECFGMLFYRYDIVVPIEKNSYSFSYSFPDSQKGQVHVPGLIDSYNIAFFSCNGVSSDVTPELEARLNGIKPLWVDVLRQHQEKPFHAMIGGGDQVYCDTVLEIESLKDWLNMKDKNEKLNYVWNEKMQTECMKYYFSTYAKHFSQSEFAEAMRNIPFNYSWDDHDIFDGYGSYPPHLQNSQVFTGIFQCALKFYLLFQHHTTTKHIKTHPKDKYIGGKSTHTLRQYGTDLAIVALDVRAKRTLNEIVTEDDWRLIQGRLQNIPSTTKHLIVCATIPLAYPRLPAESLFGTANKVTNFAAFMLEKFEFLLPGDNWADSFRKTGAYKNITNSFEEPELMDDMNDHWTSNNHMEERDRFIHMLQDIARDQKLRVSFLSGDVHVCGAAKFASSKGIPAHKDHRFMYQIVSSAIGNTPPPNAIVSILHNFSKDLQFDEQTTESMVEIFPVELNGNTREEKYLMAARNWARISMDSTGNLKFEINVEKILGDLNGETKTYSVTAPALE